MTSIGQLIDLVLCYDFCFLCWALPYRASSPPIFHTMSIFQNKSLVRRVARSPYSQSLRRENLLTSYLTHFRLLLFCSSSSTLYRHASLLASFYRTFLPSLILAFIFLPSLPLSISFSFPPSLPSFHPSSFPPSLHFYPSCLPPPFLHHFLTSTRHAFLLSSSFSYPSSLPPFLPHPPLPPLRVYPFPHFVFSRPWPSEGGRSAESSFMRPGGGARLFLVEWRLIFRLRCFLWAFLCLFSFCLSLFCLYIWERVCWVRLSLVVLVSLSVSNNCVFIFLFICVYEQGIQPCDLCT